MSENVNTDDLHDDVEVTKNSELFDADHLDEAMLERLLDVQAAFFAAELEAGDKFPYTVEQVWDSYCQWLEARIDEHVLAGRMPAYLREMRMDTAQRVSVAAFERVLQARGYTGSVPWDVSFSDARVPELLARLTVLKNGLTAWDRLEM